ncbi:hypothetical protein TorRG33x02_089270 [Trema orientale]|uniref:Uncharacterized protein n=1 Tax=Trema orientale TaxID=63057 RepID=A0A2P5FCB1_TREOI|nr:hypothetical protein TorRG33x02_089270 [Trema orientale]
MDLLSILQELMRYVYLPYLVFTFIKAALPTVVIAHVNYLLDAGDTKTRLLDIITPQSIFGSSSELG